MDTVNRLVTSCLMIHAGGGIRDAGIAPLVDGSRKSLLSGLFGQFKIAERTNQGSDNPAPIRSVDRFNGRICVRKHASC
jgi:hypothetical protein